MMNQFKYLSLSVVFGTALTACPSPLPLEIRSVADVLIPITKVEQCVTLKAALKGSGQIKFEAMKEIQEQKNDLQAYGFEFGDFTPKITKEADLDGIDQVEVSCTGANKAVVKGNKPFAGTRSAVTPDFEFSELKP
jgi:hypothetical protein